MPVMQDKEISVPVVFIDTFVNHPKWKKYADSTEKANFNSEMAKLT